MRPAPRLEVLGTGSVQVQGDELGGQGVGRATLALDDDWGATVAFEVRRVYFGTARWTGARALLTVPLPWHLRAATEMELVRPDEPDGRGDVGRSLDRGAQRRPSIRMPSLRSSASAMTSGATRPSPRVHTSW